MYRCFLEFLRWCSAWSRAGGVPSVQAPSAGFLVVSRARGGRSSGAVRRRLLCFSSGAGNGGGTEWRNQRRPGRIRPARGAEDADGGDGHGVGCGARQLPVVVWDFSMACSLMATRERDEEVKRGLGRDKPAVVGWESTARGGGWERRIL